MIWPVLAMLAAISLFFADPAEASPNRDEVTYLQELKEIGISSSAGDAQLLTAGYQVCSHLSRGDTPDEVVEQVLAENKGKLDLDHAQGFVSTAWADLCSHVSLATT